MMHHVTRLSKSRRPGRPIAAACAAAFGVLACMASALAQIPLADQPVFVSANVPGNLALALSVEFPTAISVANIGNYTDATGGDSIEYLGYFDPRKCYTYNYNVVSPSSSYFSPSSLAIGANKHQCSGAWSGNFMNWATMQTIDPFRAVLTGGYRSVDTASQTILEKAWGSAQGSANYNFHDRGTLQGSPNNLPGPLQPTPNYIPLVTPFSNWLAFDSRVWGNGNAMVFSADPLLFQQPASSLLVLDLGDVTLANTLVGSLLAYKVYVRVAVCDPAVSLEANCVKYGGHWKPEGLLQQFSSTIRFSAFSYLNQDGYNRQGGVLRAPMGFIGPTYAQPLSATPITNTKPEWDPVTGIMYTNPDTASAGASGVTQSGVMNYLNKFGETGHNYMSYDDVGELYYAVVRYFEGLGNVPEWTNGVTASELDGFPAVTTWTGTGSSGVTNDPIIYACQKNFVLGIGDDHTWYDYNVGGATDTSGSRPKPAAVASDAFNQATTWTQELQSLEGITQTPYWPFDSGATYYIAGLAYGAHVNDLRPDTSNPLMPGNQTLSTYWMDVEEGGGPENLNPYYLATKYGGFNVTLAAPPATYDMTTALNQSQWNSAGATILMNGNHTQLQPDNYYLAGSADKMEAGLKAAFNSISNAQKAFTTSFSLSTNSVAAAGAVSFASSYVPTGWTGTVAANSVTFDANGNPNPKTLWSTNGTLQSQLAGTGWQTGRVVATWDGTAGKPFEIGSLSASEVTALSLNTLSPTYSPLTSATAYLNYLRGDQSNEVGSTATGSTKSLRARSLLLGDIVDAALTPVGAPDQTFAAGTNPGYAAFKSGAAASRSTVVYAGANDGMLHAFLGTTGHEQFAYVPGALFQGPSGTPLVDGLAQLGNPNYTHHYYVDATPLAFDLDYGHTNGVTGSPNWGTLLVGGLGKGGKSYYAIDVTAPDSMTTEAAVASKVKWEVGSSTAGYGTMGFSFGAPVIIKTAKYGWVVALTSGYDNSDGYGYLYLVNPTNGALLQAIRTPTSSSGLTQASAYVKDYTDDTADSIYVGDLNGQLWRFDLTGTPSSYPAPALLAQLTDPSGVAQPITTAPLIEIHPNSRKRYVMVGTGRLLSSSDVVSRQTQSFYVIIDGTAGRFTPAPITTIVRSNLTQVLNVTSPSVVTNTSKGWYFDFGSDPSTGIAERQVLNPTTYNGVVSFATLLTTGDACNPRGSGKVYAVNYASGVSVLSQNTVVTAGVATYDAANGDYAFKSAVVDLRFVSVSGKPELIAGDSTGNMIQVYSNLSKTIATRLLNWREVPTAE